MRHQRNVNGKGIPYDLDQDSIIDPKTRNLVILDDLISTASKDSRIKELFTEGSHHRNRDCYQSKPVLQ